VAHQAGAYPGVCSMKRLGVFLLPPGWDASPSQGYPQHCESKVSCRKTQRNVSGQGLNPQPLDPETTAPPQSLNLMRLYTFQHNKTFFTCSVPYDFLSSEGGASGLCHAPLFYNTQKKHTNLLLTEYEGRALLGNIAPRSWQHEPRYARSVSKRPRANIPQCGSSKLG